jgi:hypothetical protein
MLSKKTLRLVLLGVPILGLAVAAVVLAFGPGTSDQAHADFPHPGLDVSIGSSAPACDSGGSNVCDVPAGGTITVNFNVNSLGGLAYQGYDLLLQYTEVTVVEGSLVQTGAGVWPGCAFAASAPFPGQLAAACGFGISAPDSTYTGVMMHVGFMCPSPAPASPAVITMVAGESSTDLLAADGLHGESVNESLTVTCGASGEEPTNTPPAEDTPTPTVPGDTPTPTNTSMPTTPPAATNTPTPTNTSMPPTATNTRVPTEPPAKGDVNGDGMVNAEDSLWILWQEAGIVDEVPLPENADANNDGMVNSIDALWILWIEGGQV